MVIRERLFWILDRPAEEWKDLQAKYSGREYEIRYTAYKDEEYRRNIAFVHSLGLKCDCVGWSDLDLTRPDAGEILDKIAAFCKEEGWLARGSYSRRYEDFDSEWYEVLLPAVNEIEWHKDPRFPNGERKDIYAIRAYKNNSQPALYGWHWKVPLVVSDRFRDACVRLEIPDIRFCRIRDVGRYASEQYSFLYPNRHLPYAACDFGLEYTDRSRRAWYPGETPLPYGLDEALWTRIQQLGGMLPRVAKLFYDLRVYLQDQYPANAMPDSSLVCVRHRNGRAFDRDKILLRKELAERLIGEKVLSKKNIAPALLYDTVPIGYVETEMHPASVPEEEHFVQMQAEYEALMKKTRPVRMATPKEAVKLLRKAKAERKSDFGKKLKKELADTFADSVYAALIPYYLVADGGSLSDEYALLSCSDAQTANAAFFAELAAEELLENPIAGIVFAQCADGDAILLQPDGTVAQISHEAPEPIDTWPSLAQFFVDCTEMDD